MIDSEEKYFIDIEMKTGTCDTYMDNYSIFNFNFNNDIVFSKIGGIYVGFFKNKLLRYHYCPNTNIKYYGNDRRFSEVRYTCGQDIGSKWFSGG